MTYLTKCYSRLVGMGAWIFLYRRDYLFTLLLPNAITPWDLSVCPHYNEYIGHVLLFLSFISISYIPTFIEAHLYIHMHTYIHTSLCTLLQSYIYSFILHVFKQKREYINAWLLKRVKQCMNVWRSYECMSVGMYIYKCTKYKWMNVWM